MQRGTEKPADLAERLIYWCERLGSDKSLPWVGLGLVGDLEAAAARIKGKPAPAPSVEFDL